MSFFSSAANLIRNRKNIQSSEPKNLDMSANSLELDFSVRNYAKESFSVLIIKPLSGCILKIMKAISYVITGTALGSVCALLFFLVIMQFGSMENTFLSSLIINKLETVMPDADLSIKSANLHWNAQKNTFEILLRKVRLDDMRIPSMLIVPDYTKSIQAQKLVMKDISIINPKINIALSDDFKNILFNPNMEKGGSNKALFEPMSSLNNIFRNVFDKDALVQLENADVTIQENGINWNLKNLFYRQQVNEIYPSTVDFSISFPKQKYASHFGINLMQPSKKYNNKMRYDIKIESINPLVLGRFLAKRNTPLPEEVATLLNGYNLPVSGNIQFNLEDGKVNGGNFDLIGSNGSIKLPIKNLLSLNLGKKIDNSSISGKFSAKNLNISSFNISYGNSGIQLTGINVPMSEYKTLDVANIDGTLNLNNVSVAEITSMLPDSISQSLLPAFNNYLPGFKLESFKVDLKGPIALSDQAIDKELVMSQGVFKINNAQVPLGKHVVSNISAIGVIVPDGLDIKLSNAQFGNTKINSGNFFISNKDNSWIGKVNADLTIDDIATHANKISKKLASLPLNELKFKGTANLNLDLVRIEGDKNLSQELPFRIVEGDGILYSADNTKELKLAWNSDHLLLDGRVNDGAEQITLLVDEDFSRNAGTSSFTFNSKSNFLTKMIPGIDKHCAGNFVLKLSSNWQNEKEKFDVNMDLKDATLNLPILGNFKTKKDAGQLTMRIVKTPDRIKINNLNLESGSNKISGKMEFDEDWNITKCMLDEVKTSGCDAKINLLKDGKHHFTCSAIGESFDITRALSAVNMMDSKNLFETYVNFKNIRISDILSMRNVKGNFELLNKKVVGGACYAVFGTNSTLAVSAKDIPNSDDYVLSLSASDAGEFCKYMKLSDSIKGGNINLVIKSSKNSSQSSSGVFEMKDFIVKNNAQLNRLVSLSSTNLMNDFENLSVGFNTCMVNFVMADNQIKFENGRAISPSIAISFNGNYDRLTDDLSLTGISVPMSMLLSAQNNNGALAAGYDLKGTLADAQLSVKPLKLIRNDNLRRTFGNMLPIPLFEYQANNSIAPSFASEDFRDPFSQGAFDKKVVPQEIKREVVQEQPQEITPKVEKKAKKTKEHGVLINRGLNKRHRK